jgi:hypothetical protein
MQPVEVLYVLMQSSEEFVRLLAALDREFGVGPADDGSGVVGEGLAVPDEVELDARLGELMLEKL